MSQVGIVLNRNRKVPAEQTTAFGAIAERFRRAGDLERAVALCREGLAKFPDHLSARVTLGWSLLDLGKYDEAREALEQVLRRAPDNLAAIRGLAELHDRAEHTMMLPMDGPGEWPPPIEDSEPQIAEPPADPEIVAIADAAVPVVEEPATAFDFPPAVTMPIPAPTAASVVDPPAPAPAPVVEKPAPAAQAPQPAYMGSVRDIADVPLEPISAAPAPQKPAAIETPAGIQRTGVSEFAAVDDLERTPVAAAPELALASDPETDDGVAIGAVAIDTESSGAIDLQALIENEAGVEPAAAAQLVSDDAPTVEISAADALALESDGSLEALGAVELTDDSSEIAELEALIAQAQATAEEDSAQARAKVEEGPSFALSAQSASALELEHIPSEDDQLLSAGDVQTTDELPLIVACENYVPEPEPMPEPELTLQEVVAPAPLPSPKLLALERFLRQVEARKLYLATRSVA